MPLKSGSLSILISCVLNALAVRSSTTYWPMKSGLRFDRSDLTQIRAINRTSGGSNNKNGSSTIRGGTVARTSWSRYLSPYWGLPRDVQVRKAKIDDMTDRFDIISRIPFAVPPRNAWARFATKEEHGTVRRVAGWAILPRVLFGTREAKPRRADPRDIALGPIIATTTASDGDVSWFTAPLQRGPMTCRLIYGRASVRWAIRQEKIIDSALKIDRTGKAQPREIPPRDEEASSSTSDERPWESVINYNDINYEIY